MVDNTSTSNSGEDLSGSSEEDTLKSNEEDSFSESSDERYKLTLIKEVRDRPTLWRQSSHPYSQDQRTLKDDKWQEVTCKLPVPDGLGWKTLSKAQKQDKVEEARKKWKNMKDCFFRYVAKRRRGEKSRRYRYYKQLKFLMENDNSSRCSASIRGNRKDHRKKPKPGTSDFRRKKGSLKSSSARNLLARKQISEATTSSTRDCAPSRQPSNDRATLRKSADTSTTRDAGTSMRDADGSTTDVKMLARDLPSHSGNDAACPAMATPGTSSGIGRHEIPGGLGSRAVVATIMPHATAHFEASLLEILKARREDELDEERNFALGLVPMLKELDYDKKYHAKTKILEIMKVAKYLVLDGLVDLPQLTEARSSVMSGSHAENQSDGYFDQPSITSDYHPPGEMDVDNGHDSEFHSPENSENGENSGDEQNTESAPRK